MSDAFTDQLASEIADGLGDFGFEPGTYTPPVSDTDPSPAGVACRVLMEFGSQDAGDIVTVFGPRTLATFLLGEVTPAAGGTLVLDTPHRIYGGTFRLDAPDVSWQSQTDTRWVLLNGAA